MLELRSPMHTVSVDCTLLPALKTSADALGLPEGGLLSNLTGSVLLCSHPCQQLLMPDTQPFSTCG